jgi:hypothetical protein
MKLHSLSGAILNFVAVSEKAWWLGALADDLSILYTELYYITGGSARGKKLNFVTVSEKA